MLNSTEHVISTAHKNLNAKKIRLLAFKLSNVVFIMLLNVKMPTIAGILTFFEHYKFHAQLN